MKSTPLPTRLARRVSLSVTLAVTLAYVVAGTLAAGGLGLHAGVDSRLRRRITDVRDRGALSLEQAIVTAVLSAAAIALGVVIVNAVVNHQNQIR